MRFLQWLLEAVVDLPAGIFVKVNPTADSVSIIQHYFRGLGHDLCQDLHCTVIYSTKTKDGVNLPNVDKNERFDAKPIGLAYWPGHDNDGYVVMLLESDDLKELHWRFRVRDLEPTFADYKPHVSVVHPCPSKPDWLDRVNEEIKANPVVLTFYYGGYTILDPEDGQG